MDESSTTQPTGGTPDTWSAGPPGSPPPSARNWTPILMGGLVLALAIIGLLVWLVLSSRGGTTGPLAERHTIVGTLEASECGGGYDITFANVEVRDESDKLIGSGATGANESTGGRCVVTFTIEDVPKASFYQIRIGSHDGPTYSYADMKAAGWTLQLTLG